MKELGVKRCEEKLLLSEIERVKLVKKFIADSLTNRQSLLIEADNFSLIHSFKKFLANGINVTPPKAYDETAKEPKRCGLH
jgi:hypothetical protein